MVTYNKQVPYFLHKGRIELGLDLEIFSILERIPVSQTSPNTTKYVVKYFDLSTIWWEQGTFSLGDRLGTGNWMKSTERDQSFKWICYAGNR